MEKPTIFTFEIKGFTPESMSFGRLVEYYSEIRKMFASADHVHLVQVYEGSHRTALAVSPKYEDEVELRLLAIREGAAPKPAQLAHDTINTMLKEDGTSAAFKGPNDSNIIEFPGRKIEPERAISVRGAASIVGELYHIAGSKDNVKVRISTAAYGAVFCTTTRDIAKRLGDHLFDEVKVSGRGLWTKTSDGGWDLSDLHITDFGGLRNETLRQSVDRIRRLNIAWPEDPLGEIRSFDEKNGTAH